MKIKLLLFLLVVLTVSLITAVAAKSTLPRRPKAAPAATPAAMPAAPLRIAHPDEGARLPALASTFVFGAADPSGKLTINGRPVPVHRGGGFLTMVDLSTGTFAINAVLSCGTTTYTMTRTISVREQPAVSPVSPLTIEYVEPSVDIEALPGDEVIVSCKGSPGMKAFFTVGGVEGKFPLLESDRRPGGVYRGIYSVGGQPRKAEIRVTLLNEQSHARKTMPAAGIVSTAAKRSPVVAEVSAPQAVLRAGRSAAGDKAGYMLFPPVGTRLRVTGRWGDEVRVRLSRTKDAWISAGEVRFLPEGTQPPATLAGNMTVRDDGLSAEITVPLGSRIPFEVRDDAAGKYVDVSFFGAVSNTDWISYRSSGVVEQVQWFQDESEAYRIRVQTRGAWWGYDARFEGGSFILELRRPPALSSRKDRPLKGLTVAVDAGHSPDTGAIGPTGLIERDANIALAQRLKEKLTALGARVVMTREGNEAVPLYERPRIAWQARADILISCHNNALPDGENPLKKNGFGVYYFRPVSVPLAREVHAAYGELVGKKFGLRDDGLYYGNLALPRTMQMPSILVESAYVIVPGEEALLKDDDFHRACADAIIRGIRRYVRRMNAEAASPRTDPSRISPGR